MFLLTPFVLQELGDGPYGIWSVLIATTGSYGIFDLGIRSAAGLYLTRYSAQDDAEGVNRSFSTAFVLLSGLAVIGLLATLGLASQLPEFLGSRSSGEIDPGAVGRDAQAAFLVIGASVSLCLPLALFQAVTYAKERMDLSNGLGILERLLIAGLSVWSLQADYGLFGLSCVVGGVQLVIALNSLSRRDLAAAIGREGILREYLAGEANAVAEIAPVVRMGHVVEADLRLLPGVARPKTDCAARF